MKKYKFITFNFYEIIDFTFNFPVMLLSKYVNNNYNVAIPTNDLTKFIAYLESKLNKTYKIGEGTIKRIYGKEIVNISEISLDLKAFKKLDSEFQKCYFNHEDLLIDKPENSKNKFIS